MKIVSTALLALALSTALAAAQDAPRKAPPAATASSGPMSDPAFRTYAGALKACLITARVPLDGERPGCYLDDAGHLQCLGRYQDAGNKCRDDNLPKASANRVPW